MMGCGTHFNPDRKFRDRKFKFNNDSRVHIRLTREDDPVGSGNIVIFVRALAKPWENQSEFERRAVLITLNPVISLGTKDTQVDMRIENESETTSNIKFLLDMYDQVRKQPDIPDGQIGDEPLVEFLEAVVQNILSNSSYLFNYTKAVQSEAGVDLGDFQYRAHFVAIFFVWLVLFVVMAVVVRYWEEAWEVREVSEMADAALFGQIPGHSASTAWEALDHRFYPMLVCNEEKKVFENKDSSGVSEGIEENISVRLTIGVRKTRDAPRIKKNDKIIVDGRLSSNSITGEEFSTPRSSL